MCRGKSSRYFASSEKITVIKLYNLPLSAPQFLVKFHVVDFKRSCSSKGECSECGLVHAAHNGSDDVQFFFFTSVKTNM